jgi:hypothetical protein
VPVTAGDVHDSTPAVAEWQFNDIHGYTQPDGARLIHQIAHAELWVREGRLVRGTGYQGASRASRHELARTGAILRLRQRRRYYIHAAGAVDPSGRAWLLTGPTGSGKSTLAYALARKGWPILGDDGVITEAARTGPVIAYRWREPLRVSTGLIPLFPELEAGTRHARMLPHDPRHRAEVAVRGLYTVCLSSSSHNGFQTNCSGTMSSGTLKMGLSSLSYFFLM